MVRHNSVILLIIAAIGVMSSVACASPAVLSASSLSPGMSLSNVRFQKSFLTANIPVSDTVTPLPASEGLALSGVSSERIARIRAMFIGDIHGNYTAFVALLKRAGYVDDNLEWIAGDRILVQLGDIVDRGPEEDALKTWDLLDSLQKQARRAGGEVVRLIGNHEFFYVSEYYKLHPERAIDNGMYVAINSMLRFNFTAANRWRYKILRGIEDGDIVAAWQYQDSIVTHAGVVPYFSKHKTAETLVEEFNYILREKMWWHAIFKAGKSRGKAENPHPGILWADYYSDIVPAGGKLIPQILAHTPTRSNSVETLGPSNEVVNVDVGLNPLYGGGSDAWVVLGPQSQIDETEVTFSPRAAKFTLPMPSILPEEAI